MHITWKYFVFHGILDSIIVAIAYASEFELKEKSINSIVTSQTETQSCDPIAVITSKFEDTFSINSLARMFPEAPTLIYNIRFAMFRKMLQKFSFHYSKPCNVVLYFFEALGLDLLKSLPGDFISKRLPGGFFQTYHVIFVPYKIQDYLAYRPSNEALLLQMHNLLFVYQTSPLVFELSIPDKSFTKILAFNTLQFNHGKKSFEKINTKTIFPDRWENFQGDPFIVASTPDMSQEQMIEFLRTKEFNTYAIVGIYEVSRSLNATPYVNSVKSGEFGRKLKNGSWVGMLGEVLEGRAHMTTPMLILPNLMEVADYTKPYLYDCVIFITALPKQLGSYGNIEFLLWPFDPPVWLFVCFSFLAIYIAFILTTVGFNMGKTNACLRKFKPIKILSTIIRPVMDQPLPAVNFRNTSTRAIVSLWLLCLIVLSCAYKSKLISALMTPTYKHAPKTFVELADSDYEIGAFLYNETFVGDGFRGINNKIGKEVSLRAKGYNVADSACFRNTQSEKAVCLGIKGFMDQLADNYLTDEDGQRLFQSSSDSFFPFAPPLALPKKFPHLKNLLNQIISRLESQGLIIYWYELGRRVSSIKGRRLSKAKRGENSYENSNEKRVVDQLSAIFIMGAGLGFGLFLLEVVYYHITRIIITLKTIFKVMQSML